MGTLTLYYFPINKSIFPNKNQSGAMTGLKKGKLVWEKPTTCSSAQQQCEQGQHVPISPRGHDKGQVNLMSNKSPYLLTAHHMEYKQSILPINT